jgi:beta-lactamase regulating signal transducer with metallopeptidase domain
MTGWSSSNFLQSLGWAILNSFWQMALLWIIYSLLNHLFRWKASKKYQVSVTGIALGFSWFLFTIFYYLQTSPVSSIAVFNGVIEESSQFLQMVLFSASMTYFALLVFPSYKLYRNWRFVQTIKKQGLVKAGLNYRLFVQKIASQLGMSKRVLVFASELVKSPVTVGYFKPMILIPVAALNNLSTQQVEAILLHELSHIRRFDYLVNFMISIINTILYFNPFVKLFMKNIEEERENCCDELVLQFGYDKLGYASALLTLEKLSAQHQVLALCATGKNYLLTRIEKIVGMEKKKGFKLNHFAGLFAALFCIVFFNSIMIVREHKNSHISLAYDNMGSAFNFFDDSKANRSGLNTPSETRKMTDVATTSIPLSQKEKVAPTTFHFNQPAIEMEQPENNMFVRVAQDDIDASLTKEEKEKVRTTVDATKKILTTWQWKEMDKTIADAMTEQEKMQAKQEYLKAFEQRLEIKNLEQQLKAEYEKLDWERINQNVNKALVDIRLDSLETVYNSIITEIEKARSEASANGVVSVTPLPDQSVENIRKSTLELRNQVESIRALRNPKKTVKL